MTETRTLDLGRDRSLHCITAGEGADLLLIHGAVATGRDWMTGPFQALVNEGFRVTAVDRPGHGLSRRRRFEGTPRDQARQVREGLREIGVERPIVVAHSFGGMVALAYAELFPEEVAHLVLVAPIAFPEMRLLEHSLLAPRSIPFFGPLLSGAAEATVDRPMLELIQKVMWSPQPVPDDWKAAYPYDQVLSHEAMICEGEDAAAMLPFSPAGAFEVGAIHTPTHVLTGTGDKVIEDERQAKLLARLMPNARLVEIPGIGHMLHHVRTDALLAAVREAAASNSLSPAGRGWG